MTRCDALQQREYLHGSGAAILLNEHTKPIYKQYRYNQEQTKVKKWQIKGKL